MNTRILLCAIALLIGASRGASSASVVAADKISVALYYESLCPYCRKFIVDQLYPAFNSDLGKYFSITLYPYGNAHETSDDKGGYVYKCQHGERECQLNMVEACAIDFFGPDNMASIMDFHKCLENPMTNANEDWSTCSQSDKFTLEVKACSVGDKGMGLMHCTAEATSKLEPPHNYVPWVTVNGKHNDAAEDNLVRTLCSLLSDSTSATVTSCSQAHAHMEEEGRASGMFLAARDALPGRSYSDAPFEATEVVA